MVPEDQDECAFYQSVFAMLRAFRYKNSSMVLILPTLACNARCFYCYEEGIPQTTMSPETVEQTIRYLVQNKSDGELHIEWFGGEPFLYPDIIDRICEGLREAGVKYHSTAVSNGSLITPQIIEKMTGLWNLKALQISMDGNEQDYIARKRYPVYHDYYHTVMETISRMSEVGIEVSIRCNVDDSNVDHMSSLLDDLKVGIKQKDHVYLYYEQLFGEGNRKNDVANWEKIIAFRSQIEAAGFKTSARIPLDKEPRAAHCMADRNGVVITPDGSLYACAHMPKEARFGDVWNGVTDEAEWKDFVRIDRVSEKCQTCPVLPICTPFVCPIVFETPNCKEISKRQLIDALCDRIRKKQKAEPDESIIC